jgi:hypothetical protein
VNLNLRQARDFLRFPSQLSRSDLAERHKAIWKLLQTLQEEHKGTSGYDQEVFEDVKAWLHLRRKPHGSDVLAIEERRRDGAVRPTENAIVLPKEDQFPAVKNHSIHIANSQRSAIAKARSATLPTTKPRLPKRKGAAEEISRTLDHLTVKSRKTARQSPSKLEGHTPTPLLAQNSNDHDSPPEDSDTASRAITKLNHQIARTIPMRTRPNHNPDQVSTNSHSPEEKDDINVTAAPPEEMPDLDVELGHDAQNRLEESTSASDDQDDRQSLFLIGETAHLQALMSAQIERDLTQGNSLFLKT